MKIQHNLEGQAWQEKQEKQVGEATCVLLLLQRWQV